jgi:hypothetical protein
MLGAIETRYKGYRFRSRTEARFAIFFDGLGLKWEYEFEGFKLPSGWYLPDFWFPDLKEWVEVKGAEPTEEEKILAQELRSHTKAPVSLFWGTPMGLQRSGGHFIFLNVLRYGGIGLPLNLKESDQGRIRHAVTLSRSARFEHGESPNAQR